LFSVSANGYYSDSKVKPSISHGPSLKLGNNFSHMDTPDRIKEMTDISAISKLPAYDLLSPEDSNSFTNIRVALFTPESKEVSSEGEVSKSDDRESSENIRLHEEVVSFSLNGTPCPPQVNKPLVGEVKLSPSAGKASSNEDKQEEVLAKGK